MLRLFVLLTLFFSPLNGFKHYLNPFESHNVGPCNDCGQPLLLTPYIEAGQLALAKNLSRVTLKPFEDIVGYSGFLTVNKTFNSNLFFWFFPAEVKPETAPVLLWLQGGPGGSSLFGLFEELGPYTVQQDLTLKKLPFPWTKEFSVVFIDNPVGTGFSFTDEAGYARNENDVAENLYKGLQQFFTLFNEFRSNEFYVTGESYAGKYVPAISYKIHTMGSQANLNFKGMAIGDGLCDPENQFDYADFLYQTGMIDRNGANFFRQQQDQAVALIKQEKYLDAFRIFDALLNGDLTGGVTTFNNLTGVSNYFNYLLDSQAPTYFDKYVQLPAIRKSLHVGNLTYNQGNTVEEHLITDMMKSVRPWVAVIMENYKTLFYNGQLDIIVAAPLTDNFLHNVDWSHADDFKAADRIIWKLNDKVAGYAKEVNGQFYQVVVRSAGHMVPQDQPAAAFDMIYRFVYNKGFN